jgi:rod shape-determining protein MreB and related proteins
MFKWFSKPNPYDANLFIDLGTANTLFVSKNEGLILNEPSVIAFKEVKPGKQAPVAAGLEALEIAKMSPGHIFLRYPLKEGVVADIHNTEAMIRIFLDRPSVKKRIKAPKVVIAVPFDATEVERRGTIQVGEAAGAKSIILVDEPLVASAGAGIPIDAPEGRMVIDLGGGTTEISIIALNDIVYCESLRTGGHRLVEAIVDYYKNTDQLVISRELGEELKKNFGSGLPRKNIQSFTVEGRDSKSGILKTIESNSESLSLAFDPLLTQISSGVFKAFEKTPPEIVSDIMDQGITLVGGGSLLKEIASRLSNDTQIHVKVADDPLSAMAKGGSYLLNHPEILETIQIEM